MMDRFLEIIKRVLLGAFLIGLFSFTWYAIMRAMGVFLTLPQLLVLVVLVNFYSHSMISIYNKSDRE